MKNGHGELDGLRVLVVEDTFLVAEVICDELESRGCEIVGPASRLDRALTLAALEPLDGAVLDINLAGEFCFPIAAALSERGVPFIFLTGYETGSIIPQAYEDTPRLTKPFDGRMLSRVACDTFSHH